MRALVSRGLACLTLSAWLLSAGLGQLVSIHVETDHHGYHHDGIPSGLSLLATHADEHGAHQHQISSVRGPGLPSPRAEAAPPVLAVLPLEWSNLGPDRAIQSAPIPPPRGSPQQHAILLI